MDQSRRRRSSAAVAAGVLAAGCLALLTAPATAVPADGAGASHTAPPAGDLPTGGREADFEAAAAEFHVPLSVLLAVSYQESGWDAHPGQYSADGGHGPMNLTDVTPAMVATGPAGAAGRGDLATFTAAPAQHTLTAAARLLRMPADRLRVVPRDNIRGGAALLAHHQRTLTGDTSADPARWYGAIARYSGASEPAAAGAFADRVYGTLRAGAARTPDGGGRVVLSGDPALRPAPDQVAPYRRSGGGRAAQPECPTTVTCRFLAAAASNGQVADRPSDGMDIRYIVIHDTETSYQEAIDLFQKAGGASAHYVMKADDGSVTQMRSAKDIAFHAGDYWINMHSLGIEHEGYAAQGATWYTQSQYEATADLVKYLAERYDIPLDREHVIGHDNVPAPTDSAVSDMHWDPGPYWDWTRFMGLLGAPANPAHGVGATGTAVTIAPDFATNQQTVRVCPGDDGTGATTSCVDRTAPSNLLYVHASASADSALLGDPYLRGTGAGTDDISDWSATVSAGQQYVVAGRSGDWTAIWFGGKKGWILNPDGRATVLAPGAQIVTGRGTAAVAVYGAAYPDTAEYPSDLTPSTMAPLSKYTIPVGQSYVASGPATGSDDYFASSGRLATGAKTYFTLQYNHRVWFVNSGAVTATPSG